ncbi:Esterase/lipase/thioesterase [Mycena sanguinolenta]|uniref:Esterase/lipase/thioesterase n=1 Tax=Mycena sanguinolenta TaxID=230812 RepID=A0A8H7CL65_9AGAR|nr:Esterase/lipase/thioesterase [Mycena sanguinolenta]
MAQYTHLSAPDPELPTFPRHTGPIPKDYIPILRQTIASNVTLDATRIPPESAHTVENRTIAVRGGEIAIRTISPTPLPEEGSVFPVLVWFHGGGWVAGNLEMDDVNLRILSVELRLSIVNVDYRLAPEHPFPTGLDDCYTAIKWTAENCKSIRGSLDKGFLIGGISAGANFAAAAVHRALKDPFFQKHKITGHVLQIPAVVHPAAYPAEYTTELLSYNQNANAPIVSKAAIEFFYGCLNGPPTNPELSPLLADHVGLPPLYIQICGLDPLRDEGLLYERVLREQDVRTKLDIYPGVPHGFHALWPGMTASKKWEEDVRAGVRWILALAQTPAV